jgi:two-component system, NarL family, response regulator NreC
MSEHRRIRVVVVDDHPLVRSGLKQLLQTDPKIEVSGEAESIAGVLELLRTAKPDVILLDISLGNENGLTLPDQIRAKFNYPPRIVFLSMHAEEAIVARALNTGGSAYLVKSSDTSEILSAIHRVFEGGTYIGKNLDSEKIDALREELAGSFQHPPTLTVRELEVLRLVAAGLSAKEVANKLKISPRTVEVHRNNMLKKLGVKNSTELVAVAHRLLMV